MPFKFFVVPVRDDGSAEAELNAFLGSHRVLAIDRRCVASGGEAYWAVCVDYLDAAAGSDSCEKRGVGRKTTRSC